MAATNTGSWLDPMILAVFPTLTVPCYSEPKERTATYSQSLLTLEQKKSSESVLCERDGLAKN